LNLLNVCTPEDFPDEGEKGQEKRRKLTDLIADETPPIIAATNGAIKAGRNGVPLEIHHGDVRAEARKIKNDVYEKELARLQIELVKMQDWIKHKGLRVLVIFEGATRRARAA
jgi:hypothetical protein